MFARRGSTDPRCERQIYAKRQDLAILGEQKPSQPRNVTLSRWSTEGESIEMTGKHRRLKRLFISPYHRCLLVPLDHAPWLGPLPGIDRPCDIVDKVVTGGANALLVTPGFLRDIEDIISPQVGIVLRVSLSAGLSSEALQEVPAVTVKTAMRMDADAVAVSIFFGRGGEVSIMRWLGELIEECDGLDMPVLAEMMPPFEKFYQPEAIAHAARIGMELGADIIKTNYCGDVESFKSIVAATRLPIIVAGGPSKGEDDTLLVAQEAIEAGAAGVAFGRRVWQAADPEDIVRKLRRVLFAV
jgi:fructose-bisphosphate aldolase/2-amino-3,7-dideoxy-D-threo-hept-6-ulosonate synthase